MKNCLLLFAISLSFQAQAQAQSIMTGEQVLQEIQEINYDYDWTGETPKTGLFCRLVADADYDQELTVSIEWKKRLIEHRVFPMNSETLFAKSVEDSAVKKVTYTEISKINNPFHPAKVVEVVLDAQKELATVTLKNGAQDLGAACAVAYEP